MQQSHLVVRLLRGDRWALLGLRRGRALTWTWELRPQGRTAETWLRVQTAVVLGILQVQLVAHEAVVHLRCGKARVVVGRASPHLHTDHALSAAASRDVLVVSVEQGIWHGTAPLSHTNLVLCLCRQRQAAEAQVCWDAQVATSGGKRRPRLCQTPLRRGSLLCQRAAEMESAGGASRLRREGRFGHYGREVSGSGDDNRGSRRVVEMDGDRVGRESSRGEVGYEIVSKARSIVHSTTYLGGLE